MKLHPASLLWLFALSVIIAGCEDTQPTAVNTDLEGTNNVTDSFSKRSKPSGSQAQGDSAVLAMMFNINDELAASGLNFAVESIDFFTIGKGRPSNRIHQGTIQWVPGDLRRAAQGNDITYLVDQSDGATASGLSSDDTEEVLDKALATWNNDSNLSKVKVVKRFDSGDDPDIFDSFFSSGGKGRNGKGKSKSFGSFGDSFLADIVQAGWLPWAFFEAVGGPGGGDEILAFSVSFIFVDGNGFPTDIDGDGYLDKALNEVYYNDTFGTAGEKRAGNPWEINAASPSTGIDVETVALHENGHSLGLGHFGPPPTAVMNPSYSGVLTSPLPADDAGMSTIWKSWPN
ncbi:MAG: matrixin family metalloprotease [Candidatus Marinimicrobia bacterium]|nr:matrixin family metalloprotease [Candidatus Neomarinimicrobiota bacterium]